MIKITLGAVPGFNGCGPILFNGCDIHVEWQIQGAMIAAYSKITKERIGIASTQRELVKQVREWMR